MRSKELVPEVASCFNSVVFAFQLTTREHFLKEDYDV